MPGNPKRSMAKGVTPLWTPEYAQDLSLWLDASDESTLTVDQSDQVIEWYDKGPGGLRFTRSPDAGVTYLPQSPAGEYLSGAEAFLTLHPTTKVFFDFNYNFENRGIMSNQPLVADPSGLVWDDYFGKAKVEGYAPWAGKKIFNVEPNGTIQYQTTVAMNFLVHLPGQGIDIPLGEYGLFSSGAQNNIQFVAARRNADYSWTIVMSHKNDPGSDTLEYTIPAGPSRWYALGFQFNEITNSEMRIWVDGVKAATLARTTGLDNGTGGARILGVSTFLTPPPGWVGTQSVEDSWLPGEEGIALAQFAWTNAQTADVGYENDEFYTDFYECMRRDPQYGLVFNGPSMVLNEDGGSVGNDIFPDVESALADNCDFTFGMVFSDLGSTVHSARLYASGSRHLDLHPSGSVAYGGTSTNANTLSDVTNTLPRDRKVCWTGYRNGNDPVRINRIWEDNTEYNMFKTGTVLGSVVDGVLTNFYVGTGSSGAGTIARIFEVVLLKGYSDHEKLKTYLLERHGIL